MATKNMVNQQVIKSSSRNFSESRKVSIQTRIATALLFGMLAGVPLASCGAADPNALWRIVSDDCVPTQEHTQQPGQCQLVDLKQHYAVLKDMHGRSQFLLLPTDRISGIESAALLAGDAPNYWEDGWRAEQYVSQRVGQALPRDLVGMAINSAHARSQEQLHIHIDCVQPALHQALLAAASQIGTQWSAQPIELAGHPYYAVKVQGEDLSVDPFHLLAQRLTDPATQMADQVLAVVGARFSDGTPGFYVLDSPAGAQVATSDSVLDHDCAIAPTPASKP
jgi:CDP-diacylglycerol pyrophosphatase